MTFTEWIIKKGLGREFNEVVIPALYAIWLKQNPQKPKSIILLGSGTLIEGARL